MSGPLSTAAGREVDVDKALHSGTVKAMMKHRWVVALAGMLLMMSLGAIYSWSLYTQPLICSFGWSMMTTTWAF